MAVHARRYYNSTEVFSTRTGCVLPSANNALLFAKASIDSVGSPQGWIGRFGLE